jgi:hypothetical protein
MRKFPPDNGINLASRGVAGKNAQFSQNSGALLGHSCNGHLIAARNLYGYIPAG